MSSYTLTQKEHTALKGRLMKVVNAGDPEKIIAEAEHAIKLFEEKGWPDDWSRWERAKEDAELQRQMATPRRGLYY